MHTIVSTLSRVLSKQLLRLRSVASHTVHEDFVSSRSIVLDLGANHGEFSKRLLAQYECTCFLVEANPELISELEKNHVRRVLHAAAAPADGEITFHVSAQDDMSSLKPGPGLVDGRPVVVPALRYASIVKHFRIPRVDLLKVDIEGAEIELFGSMSDAELSQIAQITVEFHDDFGFYPAAQTEKVVQRFRNLGFTDHRLYLGQSADVLFLNRRLCRGAWLEAARLRLLSRPLLRSFWRLHARLASAGLCVR